MTPSMRSDARAPMSSAGRSVVVFGWYLVTVGALFVVAPNLLLATFGMLPTQEVWIRVAGMLVLIIGYFDVRVGREDLLPFLRATIPPRVAVLIFFVAFVIAGWVKPILIVFGVIDLAGALWTAVALRSHPAGASAR